MEQILNLARKVSENAEVYINSSSDTPVQFETNRLKHIQSKQSMFVALRLIKNGRTGYATATGIDNPQQLVEDAVATAEFGQKAEFEFPSKSEAPSVKIFDPEVAKISLETMTGLGEKMIAAVTKFSSEILCEASISKHTSKTTIMNTRGGSADYQKSVFSLGVSGQLVRGTDMLFVGDDYSSCHPVLNVDEIIKTVLYHLELAKNTSSISTKRMPVIFTQNGVASAFVAPLMAAFNGKTCLEGASPICGKLGQMVFDKNLSVFDDPTINLRPGSQPVDDECVPCRKNVLIDHGKVNMFLYDLQTAAKAKKQSTGNGIRQGGLPSPSMHAFVLEQGKTSFDDMVKGIDEGLIVEYVMGATQGNVLGGDFSGNVLLGFKIENGKIVGRVKDTMVSGNIYQLLNNISAIGSDGKWVGGSLYTPSLFFAEVGVASR